MRLAISVLLFVTALGATNAAAGPADGIRLEDVSTRRFLEKSGSISREITTIKDFHSWNFVPFGRGFRRASDSMMS
jgi:hypothetical protein